MNNSLETYRSLLFVVPILVLSMHHAKAQTSATTGLWQDNSYTDTLSGKKVISIAIDPTSDTDNEFNATGIVIRCMPPHNTVDLQVMWDQKMTTDPSFDTYELDYRIGNNDVQSENWDLSTDNQSLFYPDNVLNFIQQLESSSVFVAQVTPAGMNPISATYDTAGLSIAVLPVLKACGFDQS